MGQMTREEENKRGPFRLNEDPRVSVQGRIHGRLGSAQTQEEIDIFTLNLSSFFPVT